jgi:hypothetical protein
MMQLDQFWFQLGMVIGALKQKGMNEYLLKYMTHEQLEDLDKAMKPLLDVAYFHKWMK